MGFHLEPFVWTLRGSKDFKEFGDAYDFVLTVTKTGFNKCRITGACGNLDRLQVKAVLKRLSEMGFEEIIWERK